jgi:VWFA-related protein
MGRFRGLLLIASLFAVTATYAQNTQASPASPPGPQPNASATVLHTGTQLVVVDVVVQDKNGQPVHGLKPQSFRVTEDKAPQSILHFEEHSTLAPGRPGLPLPTMPPGYFTDYTPVPPDGTLNVLLLDAMNTPIKDQSFVRLQLQQYVKHANPGTRIAIFGLANRLILLQGFTSDPDTLKNVVDHKLIPRGSSLLEDPTGSNVDQAKPSDLVDPNAPGMAELAANLQQFEAEMGAMQTQLRVQFTLDAMNTLAHYLAAFPGRKNVLWFSGSFPLSILPDPSLKDPFAVVQVDEDEFRDTTRLLSRAQVAVYPIDARGLLSQPMYDAANTGKNYTRNPSKFNSDLSKFNTSQAAEHGTMDEMASETGGKAFYNTNNLADAVAKAINAGANYYTLSYSPSSHKDDGSFRDIHVDIVGDQAGGSLQLAYRRGYYADKATPPPQKATTTPSGPTTSEAAAKSYARVAMSRGAPTPQNMLFKVRVLPASADQEAAVAPDNTLDPSVSPKGPFRRYDVDYAALPSELTLTLQPDGHHTGQMEFLAYVFDVDGRLLDATGKTYAINLGPAVYDRFLHSAMECHLQLSVPNSKETFIRLGIRDVPSNKFGVVEIPTSEVSHLAPPVYTTQPTSSKQTPAPTTAPSTSQPPVAAPSTLPVPQPAPHALPPS